MVKPGVTGVMVIGCDVEGFQMPPPGFEHCACEGASELQMKYFCPPTGASGVAASFIGVTT